HPIPHRLVPALEVRRGQMMVEGRPVAVDLEEKDPCLIVCVLYHIEAQAAGLVTDGAARIVQRRGDERGDMLGSDTEGGGDGVHALSSRSRRSGYRSTFHAHCSMTDRDVCPTCGTEVGLDGGLLAGERREGHEGHVPSLARHLQA